MDNKGFIEGVHFYFDESGLMVLSEKYLLERGFCCGNGCRHCPFDFKKANHTAAGTAFAKRKKGSHSREKN